MAREARRLLATLAAVCLGSACGTEPDALFLEVGVAYTFTAAIVRTYDCDPALGAPRDDALCGTSTGRLDVGADTVWAAMVLDTYLPSQVCDQDGCRDDPSSGHFTGMATVRVVQCDGMDGSGCDEEPAAPIPVRVTHAEVSCSGGPLPVVCDGYVGKTVMSVAVEIPSTLRAVNGVPVGHEIRGPIIGDLQPPRAGMQGEWVLR